MSTAKAMFAECTDGQKVLVSIEIVAGVLGLALFDLTG